MNYTITPEQLSRIIKTFYGPLDKQSGENLFSVYKGVTKWVNQDGVPVFMLMDKIDMGINEHYFHSLMKFLNIKEGTPEYGILWDETTKYMEELAGMPIQDILGF